jgi:hypothetical protein
MAIGKDQYCGMLCFSYESYETNNLMCRIRIASLLIEISNESIRRTIAVVTMSIDILQRSISTHMVFPNRRAIMAHLII